MKTKSELKAERDAEYEARTSDKMYVSYAKQFYDGYLTITNLYPKEQEQHAVKYFLLLRTFELLAKAFMRSKGAIRKELMGYGHNLEAIVRALHENYDTLIDVPTMERLFLANEYYKEKMFEYPIQGYKSLPSLAELRESIHLFMSFVNSKVWGVPPFDDMPRSGE